jgi:hypothetical protein
MSRLFHTGFEAESGAAPYLFDDSNSFSVGLVGGIARSGVCYGYTNGNGIYGAFLSKWAADKTELYVRACVNPQSAHAQSDYTILSLRDENDAPLFEVVWNSTAGEVLESWLGTHGTGTLVDSETASLTTWYVIEVHLVVHNLDGLLEVRLDGTTLYSEGSLDTRPGAGAYITALYLGHVGGTYGAPVLYDDIAVNDTTGDKNNSWCGLGGIVGINPTGDGSNEDFSPHLGGDNYAEVDDTDPDGDATYVQAVAIGNIDTYVTEDLPGLEYSVVAVGVRACAKLAAVGSDGLAAYGYDGGDAVESDGQVLTTSYKHYMFQLPTAPDGGAWTVAKVNAAELGIKAVTP